MAGGRPAHAPPSRRLLSGGTGAISTGRSSRPGQSVAARTTPPRPHRIAGPRKESASQAQSRSPTRTRIETATHSRPKMASAGFARRRPSEGALIARPTRSERSTMMWPTPTSRSRWSAFDVAGCVEGVGLLDAGARRLLAERVDFAHADVGIHRQVHVAGDEHQQLADGEVGGNGQGALGPLEPPKIDRVVADPVLEPGADLRHRRGPDLCITDPGGEVQAADCGRANRQRAEHQRRKQQPAASPHERADDQADPHDAQQEGQDGGEVQVVEAEMIAERGEAQAEEGGSGRDAGDRRLAGTRRRRSVWRDRGIAIAVGGTRRGWAVPGPGPTGRRGRWRRPAVARGAVGSAGGAIGRARGGIGR